MSYEVPTIQDLPDEMLEEILRHLPLEDCKSAMLVCKRWSKLRPFDLAAVQLTIYTDRFDEKDYQDFRRSLLASSLRRYKNVVVWVGVKFDLLLEILRSVSRNVQSLQLKYYLPLRYGVVRPSQGSAGLKVFAEIAKLLSSNLKHFRIKDINFVSDCTELNLVPWPNLEELSLRSNLLTWIPNMQNVMPNIRKLHLRIDSDDSLDFLRHLSSQLVELKIWFDPEDDLQALYVMYAMQFPLLETLTLSSLYDVYDGPTRSDGEVERFFHQLSRLKALTLRWFSFIRVRDLFHSTSCENIQFLCLVLESCRFLAVILEEDDVLAICMLKQLKRLHIENGLMIIPRRFDFEPLNGLYMLSLKNVGTDVLLFNRFRRHTFPNLTIFELLNPNDGFRDMLAGMPFLKRLTITLDRHHAAIELGSFLKLCATPGSRELRIRCYEVRDANQQSKQLRPIMVEILVLEVRTISMESLQTVITSMGKLKRLELASSNNQMEPEQIRSLQATFPRCEIFVKKKVQTEEPM